jgi:hypothetical protein
MKFAFLSFTAFAFSPVLVTGAEECSHGILYVSDAEAQAVYGYGLDSGLSDLTKVAEVTGLQGAGALALDTTNSGLYLVATYWGVDTKDYQDGVVNFIDTGVELHNGHLDTGAPSVLTQAQLDCGPVWHVSGHAGYIALYCDGSFDNKVNSTFYIMEESALGSGGSPYLVNYTLAGSHHGIALPVSSTRFLHSVALSDRISGNENATSLPDHFQVIDMEANVVVELKDSSDPSSHCAAYHGGSAVDNAIYMCCEDKILVVEFDPDTTTFERRVIDFPDTISEAHRCGSIYTTSQSKFVVSDNADWYADVYAPHLTAFPKDATEITDADVLVLGETGQCDFGIEHAVGEYVAVLQHNGLVEFYSYARPDGWKLEASASVEGVTECDAVLLVGNMQAFVAVPKTKMLYSMDLQHIAHGEGVEVSTLALGFTPNDMTVGGVPPEFACGHHEEGDKEGDSVEENKASSAPFCKAIVPFMLLAAAFGIVG